MGEIRIEGLTKVYSGNVTALDRLDLTINDGVPGLRALPAHDGQ